MNVREEFIGNVLVTFIDDVPYTVESCILAHIFCANRVLPQVIHVWDGQEKVASIYDSVLLSQARNFVSKDEEDDVIRDAIQEGRLDDFGYIAHALNYYFLGKHQAILN